MAETLGPPARCPFSPLFLGVPSLLEELGNGFRTGEVVSRGHFPILSRDPSFQKTIRTSGETAGF